MKFMMQVTKEAPLTPHRVFHTLSRKELVAPVPATLIAMLAGLMIGLFAMPKDRMATAEGQQQIDGKSCNTKFSSSQYRDSAFLRLG